MNGIKVLIVEDNLFVTEVLTRQLANIASEILCATNLVDALEMMRRLPPPDFVILDVNLEGKDDYPASTGIATLQKIQEFKSINPDAFVMVLTGTTEDYREMALSYGADGFHLKMSTNTQEGLLGAVRDSLLTSRPTEGPRYMQSWKLLQFLSGLLKPAPHLDDVRLHMPPDPVAIGMAAF